MQEDQSSVACTRGLGWNGLGFSVPGQEETLSLPDSLMLAASEPQDPRSSRHIPDYAPNYIYIYIYICNSPSVKKWRIVPTQLAIIAVSTILTGVASIVFGHLGLGKLMLL